MLITHHPLLFSAVKKVTDEDFITRRIVKLIQNDISYYAMHTNYDVLGMAELAGKVLDIAHTDVLDVTQTDEVGEEKGNRKNWRTAGDDDVGRMLRLCKA